MSHGEIRERLASGDRINRPKPVKVDTARLAKIVAEFHDLYQAEARRLARCVLGAVGGDPE